MEGFCLVVAKKEMYPELERLMSLLLTFRDVVATYVFHGAFVNPLGIIPMQIFSIRWKASAYMKHIQQQYK